MSIQIQKVTDKSFRKYGRILTGEYDVTELMDAMEKTECPDDAVIYIPSDKEIEKLPVMKAFTDYHACIMGIQEDMQMNADMDISYRDHGMYRNKKTLSAGLKDLTDICERVAMVDVMYPVERPVLIMDDPFVNLDDENMVGAKRLLSLLEEKYQIIYFTCSKNRVL